ncbi:hypothetical protein AN1V17_20670 [Vallitalea sediminicola]
MTSLNTIPKEMMESANIDGCGYFKIYLFLLGIYTLKDNALSIIIDIINILMNKELCLWERHV